MKFSTIYQLIFCSHTNPTKFMMGVASIAWPIIEYITHGELSLYFIAVLLYGVGTMWRIFDYTHRSFSSFSISMMGACLWTYEAWSNILRVEPHTSHIILPIIFALSSLWLLLRCGTGEIINKHPPHHCPLLRTEYDVRNT